MSEYDINKIDDTTQQIDAGGTYQAPENKPNYTMAFLAGLGASVLVGIALAAIGIWLESEYMLALCIGAVIVATVIGRFVPRKSIGGAIIGAILTPATYFIYQSIMAFYGYSYEKDGDTWFWFLLIGSAVFGAYMGYNNNDD
jgi:MFS family permease